MTKTLIKLQPYNGTGSLDVPGKISTHHILHYYQWGDEDCYYHLCASLEGAAGQVLWDASSQATTKDII